MIVGGGSVAARKVASLRAAGADIVVIAPALGVQLEALLQADPEAFEHVERAFREGDAQGAMLVVAAASDPEANVRVRADGLRHGVPVNVVDDPRASDVLIPSVLERGPLQIAVSTAGRAPAVSAALRRSLENEFSEEWTEAVVFLGNVRQRLMAADEDADRRRELNRELAQLDLVSLVEEGGAEAVRRAVDRHLGGVGPWT